MGPKANQFVSYEPFIPEQEIFNQSTTNPKKNLSIKMPKKEFKSNNTIGDEEANPENEKMKSTIRADETIGEMTRKNVPYMPDSPTRVSKLDKSKNRLASKAQISVEGNKTDPKSNKKDKKVKKSDNASDKNGIDIQYNVD